MNIPIGKEQCTVTERSNVNFEVDVLEMQLGWFRMIAGDRYWYQEKVRGISHAFLGMTNA